MRKLLTIVAGTLISGSVLAGGLVTNNNQSAMFTRLQNRNASTSIDAVYFNPAGLTRLGNGFYFSINNQTIQQKQTVRDNYTFLKGTKPIEYIGKVSAPIYPGVYVAYKTGKIALSAGFNPIGGGGGATYDTGLPSIEMKVADLLPTLSAMGLTTNNYSADIFFQGSSVYFGYQANISYAFNDMISAAVGARLVSAKNTYKGHINSIMINPLYAGNPTAALISAPAFFTAIGQPTYAAKTSNTEADAEMKGTGFTPIISVNIAPSEKLDFSLRYEFKTTLNLKTTVNDGKSAGMFIQDSVAIADLPAALSFGVDFKPISKLTLSGSLNYYFDKNVDYDGQPNVNDNQIDKNFIEFGLGAEYGLSEKLRISAGWASTMTGVNSDYQSDMSFSTNTNSLGAGFGYQINDMIDLNVGGQYTFYNEGTKNFSHYWNAAAAAIPVTETYNKSTWLVGIGLNFTFGK
jgi:long-chain fatty acid transport protein